MEKLKGKLAADRADNKKQVRKEQHLLDESLTEKERRRELAALADDPEAPADVEGGSTRARRTDADPLLNTTAEAAEWARKKKERKADRPDDWDEIGTGYRQYEKSTAKLNVDLAAYERQKAAQGDEDFYATRSQLDYGKTGALDAARVDEMAALAAGSARKGPKRRRDHFHADQDVDYINEANRKYNKKLAKAYDKYTVDIRQNLERGTAL